MIRATLHFLTGLALGVLIALGLASIAEDRLQAVERGYRNGTHLADHPAYAQMYATTTSRELRLQLIRGTPERDLCTYHARADDWQQRGVLTIDYDADGRAIDATAYPVRTARSADAADWMLLANVADMTSTGMALTTGGFAEANPLGVGGALVAKAALHVYADVAEYPDCVRVRSGVAPVISGVTAWNLALWATSLWPVALIAGVATAQATEGAAYEDAVYRCLLP